MSLYDFAFGGLSGMIATFVIQPLDTVKVRIQLIGEKAVKGSSKSFFSTAKNIFANEGARGFYKGLDSALFRQATYSTARLGIYKTLFHKEEAKSGKVSFLKKIQISLTAGFVGSLIGCPSDLTLVRFQSDAFLPINERRNYKNIFEAFARIIREEGLFTLWRGSAPTIGRAMAMNMGMLTTYDEIKERINKVSQKKDTFKTQIIASMSAGFVCSFLSLPFDNVKIKLQNMKKNSANEFPYKGMLDCFVKSVKREGVIGLWVGFPTFVVRVGKHSVLILIIQDHLHSNFNPYKKKAK